MKNKQVYKPLMVTIRCATFNHEFYIRKCLDGFIMQKTKFPFAAVVIDDASTDKESEVLRKFINTELETSSIQKEETDDFVSIVAPHKRNKNCTFVFYFLKYNHYSIKKDKNAYFKKWIDKARYIAYCEGDDYWTDPLKLQKQYDALEKYPECSYSSTGFIIKKNGEKDKDMTIYTANSNDIDIYGIENYGKWIGKTLTLFLRSNIYEKYFNENIKKYEAPKDTHMLYHFLKQGKCAYIPLPMGVYNNNGQGVWNSKSYAEKIFSSLKTRREIYKKNNNDKDFYFAYINTIILYLKHKEVKKNKFGIWCEGMIESNNLKDKLRITRSYLSYIKYYLQNHF